MTDEGVRSKNPIRHRQHGHGGKNSALACSICMNEEAGIIIGFSQHNSRLIVTEILILTVVGIYDILILDFPV